MNTVMNIDEACDVLELFALANNLDPLTGVEVMTKYFKQISQLERTALIVFMDETKK
jgi:hypothetical protein